MLRHSKDEGTLLRILRKLHVRLFHASAEEMWRHLQLGGVDGALKRLCHTVEDTCRICRPWKRPGPRNISTNKRVEDFNEQVEFDLMFWDREIIVHLIDVSIRWSECGIAADRATKTILEQIKLAWIARWSPPRCLISDGEGAIDNRESRTYFERIGTQLKIRPPGGIGASTVERHNELFRNALHKIKDQTEAEGIEITPQGDGRRG